MQRRHGLSKEISWARPPPCPWALPPAGSAPLGLALERAGRNVMNRNKRRTRPSDGASGARRLSADLALACSPPPRPLLLPCQRWPQPAFLPRAPRGTGACHARLEAGAVGAPPPRDPMSPS